MGGTRCGWDPGWGSHNMAKESRLGNEAATRAQLLRSQDLELDLRGSCVIIVVRQGMYIGIVESCRIEIQGFSIFMLLLLVMS